MWKCGRHRQALQMFALISSMLFAVYVLWGMIGGWTKECTIDYVNNGKVFQTSDCVVGIIRKDYVIVPKSIVAPSKKLTEARNPITQKVLSFLDHKVDGFYVEYPYAGEGDSSTTHELGGFNWKGIIIEPSADQVKKLDNANRNAHIVPACLSLHKYPMVHHHHATTSQNRMKRDAHSHDHGAMAQPAVNIDHLTPAGVQCFPLFSILLALEHTTVEYLSLKIDKPEAIAPLLSTIPWFALNIKVVAIEYPANADTKSSSSSIQEANYQVQSVMGNVYIYVRKD